MRLRCAGSWGGARGAPRGAGRGQRVGGPRELSAQAVRLEELPVVEVEAVAEPEAGEEVAAVKRRRLAESAQAGRARLGVRMAVGAALGEEPAELLHVEPEPVPAEGDALPARGGPAPPGRRG